MVTSGSRLRPLVSPAKLAAVLLLALLGHFVVMATPLHADAVRSEGISALQGDPHGEIQHCLGCGPPGLSTRGGDPADDCALQLAPPAGLSIRVASSAAPFGQPWELLNTAFPAYRLIARLGLPEIHESQAFLQVFRN
jgi:hypothetical protein